jgi:geranylgeranyl pyrophosphate synthase
LYQINDDFKNLFDNQYINLKGLYDDLNEQKLSFPVLAYLQSNQVSTTEKLQFLETF